MSNSNMTAHAAPARYHIPSQVIYGMTDRSAAHLDSMKSH